MVKKFNTDSTLNQWFFWYVKQTKNADPDKYKYNGYSIGFNSRPKPLFTDGSKGRNVIISWADMSSVVYVDKKWYIYILIFGEGPTKRLDDTTLTAEAIYPINFT